MALEASTGWKRVMITLSKDESEILIALITYVEQHLASCPYDEIEAALQELRPFRSRLLANYLATRLHEGWGYVDVT